MNQKILGLDTATDACSVALLVGDTVLERLEIAPRRHGQLVFPMIAELLAESGLSIHELDAIAFGRGPGAFTGVRVAACVIQGLAFGLDLPVVPVSTLRAMAQRAWVEKGATQVLAGFDARMGEVYWGTYRLDGHEQMRAVHEDVLCPPDQVPVPSVVPSPVPSDSEWLCVGGAWQGHRAVLEQQCQGIIADIVPEYYPRAREIAQLGRSGLSAGEAVAADQALPVYLRDQVTRRTIER